MHAWRMIPTLVQKELLQNTLFEPFELRIVARLDRYAARRLPVAGPTPTALALSCCRLASRIVRQ
jgi:hypothetical protein